MFELWIKSDDGEMVLHHASDNLTDIQWLRVDQEKLGYDCEIKIKSARDF